jgi:hypothetical protein
MTTKTELIAALQAKGITIEDEHGEFGDETRIMWAQAYNHLSGRHDDGLPERPDLLMGWHWGGQMIHISTLGCEFILEPLARYSTEHAVQQIARFVSGTYVTALMGLSHDPVDDDPYFHVRDYPITD